MKKAIISVSDKMGLVDFAGQIAPQFEILATSGTFQLLKTGGVPAQKIEDYTGTAELLGGKVKTLHPKIFASILGGEEEGAIRLVVVDLYPVEKGEIDIGGSALLRAAAKNYEQVVVICDPKDYEEVARRLHTGGVDLEFRRKLAGKAFQRTASYDARAASSLGEETFPDRLTLSFTKSRELAYGENPDSKAALYLDGSGVGSSAAFAVQLQGKPLSYNNILDADAALALAAKFEGNACVIVKHNNPCGVAVRTDVPEAFARAFEADPLSAFGGVVAFNCRVDGETAKAMAKRFFDLVIAPDYEKDAIECFRDKARLRVLRTGPLTESPKRALFKEIAGGLLVQTNDPFPMQSGDWKAVTDAKPTDGEIEDLLFAAKVNQETKSNSSVVAKEGVALGVGAGQTSRIDSVFLALRKAGDLARGAVLSSDGFFPFADSIEEAAKAGIAAIVQPGGSKRDGEVIEACNRFGIAMVFTGKRLFKH